MDEWKTWPALDGPRGPVVIESRRIGGHTAYRVAVPVTVAGSRPVQSCRDLGCYGATLGPFCVTHAGMIDR